MLLSQNLENHPERIGTARRIRRPVTIHSTDTDSACTIVFGNDNGSVCNDAVGNPSVTIMATVDQILDVSQLRMRAGGLLPVGLFTTRGFSVLGAILTRKMVVRGLLTHPLTALRVISLVSVVS
ncbi:hypothetical protein [Nocardia farcinica]